MTRTLSYVLYLATVVALLLLSVESTVGRPIGEHERYLMLAWGEAGDANEFEKHYHRLLKATPLDPNNEEANQESANRLLERYFPDKALQQQIRDCKVPPYDKNGVVSHLPGGKPEWPPAESGLLANCNLAKSLLTKAIAQNPEGGGDEEGNNWDALEILLLDRIITDKEYSKYQGPKRVTIAAGLARIDFQSKYPNCVSPWPVSDAGASEHADNLTVGKKAKLIAAILRLRTRRVELTDPNTACADLDIHKNMNQSLCVRALVAGGSPLAVRLLDTAIKDYETLTMVGGCLRALLQGPHAASKFYTSRKWPADPGRREFVRETVETLDLLEPWHDGAKQLNAFCPCENTPMPIGGQVRKTRVPLTSEALADIQMSETLFWTLTAAQWKDMAGAQLMRLRKLLEHLLKELPKPKAVKIENYLDSMDDAWRSTVSVTLYHVAEYPDKVQAVLDHLQKGDVKGARSIQVQVLKDTVTKKKCSKCDEYDVNMFIGLLIDGFLTPQALAPAEMNLLRPDDWRYNALMLRMVRDLREGESVIQTVDERVSQEKYILMKAQALFLAGRFRGLLSLSLKDQQLIPLYLLRRAKLCAMKRKDVCSVVPEESEGGEEDLTGTLFKVIPAQLCKAFQTARGLPAIHDTVFGDEGRQCILSIGSSRGESALQPPLPGEQEEALKPLEGVQWARVRSPPPSMDEERLLMVEKEKEHVLNVVAIPKDMDIDIDAEVEEQSGGEEEDEEEEEGEEDNDEEESGESEGREGAMTQVQGQRRAGKRSVERGRRVKRRGEEEISELDLRQIIMRFIRILRAVKHANTFSLPDDLQEGLVQVAGIMRTQWEDFIRKERELEGDDLVTLNSFFAKLYELRERKEHVIAMRDTEIKKALLRVLNGYLGFLRSRRA